MADFSDLSALPREAFELFNPEPLDRRGRTRPVFKEARGLVASIVHLTDLHLFEGDKPNTRRQILKKAITGPPKDIPTTIALLQRTANGDAWSALQELVVGQAQQTGADFFPIVVAVTGDVEAFGADHNGHYLGYQKLHRLLDQIPTAHRFELFGNHDIWPGRIGLAAVKAHENGPARIAQAIPQFSGPWDCVDLPSSPPLRFHRINTVDPSPVTGGLMARGRIGAEPGVTASAFVARVNADLGGEDDRRHIVFTHHPLRTISAPLGRRLVQKFNAAVTDPLVVLGLVDQRSLVISGHIHQLHPPFGSTSDTDQLVGEAPMMTEPGPDGTWSSRSNSSVVCYDLFAREKLDGTFRGDIRVSRRRYEFSSSAGVLVSTTDPSTPALARAENDLIPVRTPSDMDRSTR